jgi:predicted ArsR family transcriptional regulator
VGVGEAIELDRAETAWIGAIADPVRLAILRSLIAVGDATVAEPIAFGSASSQTIRRHLESLVAVGIVAERTGESDGETAGRPASRFSLQPEVREGVRVFLDLFDRDWRDFPRSA